MKNKVSRKVIGFIAIIGLLVIIFLILPASIKGPMKESIQSFTMPWSPDVIKQIKDAKVPNNDVSFGSMLARYKGAAWTIGEKNVDENGNGSMTIYGDAYKVDVEVENPNADDTNTSYPNCHVRLKFDVTRANGELTKGTLVSVSAAENEYTQESPYYQLLLNFLCSH